MLSDCCIGINSFYNPIPYSQVLHLTLKMIICTENTRCCMLRLVSCQPSQPIIYLLFVKVIIISTYHIFVACQGFNYVDLSDICCMLRLLLCRPIIYLFYVKVVIMSTYQIGQYLISMSGFLPQNKGDMKNKKD